MAGLKHERTFENGSFGVRAIVEDKDGSIWLSNCISRFVEDPNAPAGAAGEPLGFRKERGIATADDAYSTFVSSIRDKDGDLWVAVLGGGVYRYDGKTWTHYQVLHEGKPMWVRELSFDKQGRLWLGTQGHGVYRLDGKEGKFERVMG